MNPCLLYRNPSTHYWFAWNEDGRLIKRFDTATPWHEITQQLFGMGYSIISSNSRLADTIRDKLARKYNLA